MKAATVRGAFQRTAEATGGDILQCCIDCGEPPVIERDGLLDYLPMYGGPDGEAVFEYCRNFPGNMDDLNRELTRMRVPRTWS